MSQTSGTSSVRAARGRRGSIYAVVLAMAILVSLIGLSAVAVGRINLRTASGGGDASSAELLALSAVEHATSVINREPGWRNNLAYAKEEPTGPVPLGTGTFSWHLRDELDANIKLDIGGIQPVRVFGTGQAGDARRKYSVVLVPTGTNLMTNPGMEGGVIPYEPESGNCNLAVTPAAPHNGVRSLAVTSRTGKTGGPRQDVQGKVNSGKSYYVEAWLKMSTTSEIPKITLVVNGSGGILGLANWERKFSASPVDPVGLDWKRVGVAINPDYDGTVERMYLRIETLSTAQDFWVDDMKLIESTSLGVAMPMSPARETWKQEAIDAP